MMNTQKIILRPPVPEDKDAFIQAFNSFKNENSPFQFTFHFDDTFNFQDYLKTLENWSQGIDLPKYFVPTTFLVGVIEDRIIGRVSIRHQLNEYLKNIGGHIGCGVVRPYRKRGFATQMLRQAISICLSINIDPILVTCDEDDLGASVLIERCGGVLENITDYPELDKQKRRYWISGERGNPVEA